MNDSELADTLRKLPLLQSFSEDAKTRVAAVILRVSTIENVADGEPLIKQRTLGGHDGYVLLQGEVVVEKEASGPIVVKAPALLGEMLQFNPRAQRTATVRAHGHAATLRFSWEEFYSQARQILPESEQSLLMEAIERGVWERFGSDTIIDLALFNGLSDRLKLTASLVLQWMVQHVTLADNQKLFAQDDLCGATGFVLVDGAIQLARTNYPPRIESAPAIIGVMPRFDHTLKWSATATAKGDAQLLRFSWQEFMVTLARRLTQEESDQFAKVLDANADAHFVH